MNPLAEATLEALYCAHQTGDLAGIARCYEPNAVLRAPFLSEPIRGWRSIETHLATVVFPHVHALQVTHTREEDGTVIREWQAQVKDRHGIDHLISGESHYRFSSGGRIAEVAFHLEEASLRLLVLRRA